jgi:hypothetical protein
MRPFAFAVFSVSLAAPAFGADVPTPRADAPETLLSPTTQFYLRWDGIGTHKEAYKNSFWGGVMAGPTGDSIRTLLSRGAKVLGSSALSEPLEDGRPPQELKAGLADRKAIEQVVELLADRGAIVAAEARGPTLTIRRLGSLVGELLDGQVPGADTLSPDATVIVIVPDVGDKREVLFGTLRVLLGSGPKLFGAVTIGPFASDGRKGFQLTSVDSGPKGSEIPVPGEPRAAGPLRDRSNESGLTVRTAWWMEGKHFVFYRGTRPPADVVAEMAANKVKGGLTGHPLFKRCLKTGAFESVSRGFIDTGSLIGLMTKLAGPFVPGLKERLAANGIDGLKAVVFSSGFEGKEARALYEFDVPGERKGITRLLKNVPLGVNDLPPMPPDVTRFSALRVDFPAALDAGLGLIESLGTNEEVGVEEEAGRKNFPAIIAARKRYLARELDRALGISVSQDLLPHLGDRLVMFQTPGEGLQMFGTVVCISVKDAEKVKTATERIQSSCEALANSSIKVRKRTLKGVEYQEFYARGFGVVTPTYAIVGDWLVIALQPQAVQGFILRAKGSLEKWKPDAATAKRLAKLPADACGLQYCDPRSTVTNLCVLGAPFVSGLNLLDDTDSTDDSASDYDPIDGVLVPNAYELNSHLFPNLTVTRDDGKTIRIEVNESFSLPFEALGLETIGVLAFLGSGLFI